MRILLLSSITLLLAASCTEKLESPRADRGYDYFPLELGTSWRYAVDSIVLLPGVGGTIFDSVHLQARETLVDTLRDEDGLLWYRGERYERRHDSLPWIFRQTFLLGRDELRAYRRENNLTFVKLTFPVVEGRTWDGHVFFDSSREIDIGGQPVQVYSGWEYVYQAVAEPWSSEGLTFDTTVLVGNADFDEFLDRRYVLERYAEDRGLVYRELQIFHTQCQACCGGDNAQCFSLPWREKAERGYILRQTLVE